MKHTKISAIINRLFSVLILLSNIALGKTTCFTIDLDNQRVGIVKERVQLLSPNSERNKYFHREIEHFKWKTTNGSGPTRISSTSSFHSSPRSTSSQDSHLTTGDGKQKIYVKQYTFYLNRKITDLGILYKAPQFFKQPTGWSGFQFQTLTAGATGHLPVYIRWFSFQCPLSENPCDIKKWGVGSETELIDKTAFYFVEPVLQLGLHPRSHDQVSYHYGSNAFCIQWPFQGKHQRQLYEFPLWKHENVPLHTSTNTYTFTTQDLKNIREFKLTTTLCARKPSVTSTSSSSSSSSSHARSYTVQSITAVLPSIPDTIHQLKYTTEGDTRIDIEALRAAVPTDAISVPLAITERRQTNTMKNPPADTYQLPLPHTAARASSGQRRDLPALDGPPYLSPSSSSPSPEPLQNSFRQSQINQSDCCCIIL